jgi:uncharacterized protein (TIGR00730 family)
MTRNRLTARPMVAVFGSGGGSDPEGLAQARRLGASLAGAGLGVLNGGYGGTMEAAAAGAREVGGEAVGVTCAEFTFRSGPNDHLTGVVEAPTLFARLEHLVREAAAYVVLPGGNGTLAELSLAWECVRKGLVEPRPLVVWRDPWYGIVERLSAGPWLGGGLEHLTWVDDVEEAVAAVRAGIAS